MKALAIHPEIVVRKGKPVAVILEIDTYRELLERLEDAEDLRELERLRQETTEFRPFEDFMKEYAPDV